jgi:ubiquinone/menaquinone biosynthesis C-methylase UbiE
MNTIWSNYVQSVGTLYFSRSLRFADCFQEKYKEAFDIGDKSKILEIGCGPGAFAESLLRWYPHSQITGIDRDSNFIEFASRKTSGISFFEADATKIPFADGSFDVTISNTVAEHIEPSKFYGEQYRVLKENGVCLVLSARRGVHIPAPCICEETEFEQELWRRADPYFQQIRTKYSVCEYPQSEAELPLCMEKYGFRNVTTEYITVNLTPDNPCYTSEMAHDMINANRQNDLDNAQNMLCIANEVVTPEEVAELMRLVNARYDQRIRLYDQGIKQWDTNLSVTMIVRGIK